jgi:hypothetical protein
MMQTNSDSSNNATPPSLDGLDELMTLQIMSGGGGRSNNMPTQTTQPNNVDGTVGAFRNPINNSNHDIHPPTFAATAGGSTVRTNSMGINTSIPTHHQGGGHNTTLLSNSQVIRVKTGEPTSYSSHVSQLQRPPLNNGGDNQSEIARTSSEPMLNTMLPLPLFMESIDGQESQDFPTSSKGFSTSNNINRRNSEPASNIFEEVFDQLYNNSNSLPLDDIFADGYHSPPPEPASLGITKRPSIDLPRPSRRRSLSEPSSFDPFGVPESIVPVDSAITTMTEGEMNLHKQQTSRTHLLNATTFAVPTKAGDSSRGSGDALTKQRNNKQSFKRSRSADPMQMQDILDRKNEMQDILDRKNEWNVSTSSNNSQNGDQDEFFSLLSPQERQQLERLGIYSNETQHKRRRSEPLLTEEFLRNYNEMEGSKGGSAQKNETNLNASFSSAPLPDITPLPSTDLGRTSSDMIQMILGIKRDESAQQNTNTLPHLNTTNSINDNAGSNPSVPMSDLHHLNTMASTSNSAGNASIASANAVPNFGTSQVIEQKLPKSSHHLLQPITTKQVQKQGLQHNVNTMNLSQMSQLYADPIQTNTPNTPLAAPQAQISSMSQLFADRIQTNTLNTPLAAPQAQIGSIQQPPNDILSVPSNEDEYINMVAAIKETQMNLQTLHPIVAQQQDRQGIEHFAKALELTATCTQFVLISQFQTAQSLLNQAWLHIKIIENRLASPGPVGPLSSASASLANDPSLLDCPSGPLRLPTQKAKVRKKKKSQKPLEKEVVPELMELPPPSKDDPEIIMTRLNALMERTLLSQKQLQNYDKQNGLPRSHSQTMVNSNRSRKQLQKGVILKKWDGKPLISGSGKEDLNNDAEHGKDEQGLATNDTKSEEESNLETAV